DCAGWDGPDPTKHDLCIENLATYSQGLEQLYLSTLGAADADAHSRVITRGLVGLKGGYYFQLAKSLPNASWATFTTVDPNTFVTNIWMAKLPPLQAFDTVDRSTFLRVPVTLTPPLDARIVKAVVRFGY